MCGIGALIAKSESLPAQGIVAAMGTVAHRGPDGEGFLALYGSEFKPKPFARNAAAEVNDARVLLGHRRLAIVDVSSRGHQPMANPDGMIWITYNGEIYNHAELRVELEASGYRFCSTSDTEVLIAAYLHWGEACLHRFNGMFAFVLLDRRRRLVWAARDRFGVKPLYYWYSPNGALAIASEIKQFTALSGWRARLNGPRARDFLVAGAYEHTNETLFRGVKQLRGGEAMRLSLDDVSNLQVDRWYALQARDFSGTSVDAIESFRELLTDSVRLRLRADVSVGSCLSGGLDSSAIVCLASELRSGSTAPQLAFSALSDFPSYDERVYAQSVAQQAGVELHCVVPSPNPSPQDVDQLVWRQDEPFSSTSLVAQSEVFRLAAANGMKVMLDGQGADEVLGGYPVFGGTALADLAKKFHLFSLLRELRMAQKGTLYLFAGALLPPALRAHVRDRVVSRSLEWLNYARIGCDDRHDAASDTSGARVSFERLSRDQLTRSSLPALLHWEDRNSMAYSVEARVPFLDYRLVEFALGLPTWFKFEHGLGKQPIRRALRGIVPDIVLNRRDKLGFQLAEDEFMREHPSQMRKFLIESVHQSEGIIRSDIVELFDQFVAGAQSYSYLFWRVASFSRWMQRFEVSIS